MQKLSHSVVALIGGVLCLFLGSLNYFMVKGQDVLQHVRIGHSSGNQGSRGFHNQSRRTFHRSGMTNSSIGNRTNTRNHRINNRPHRANRNSHQRRALDQRGRRSVRPTAPPVRYIPKVEKVKKLSRARKVWIPPGTFTMGASFGEEHNSENEKPQRRVRLTKGFWMWQTEVTQGEYRAIMRANPSYFRRCGRRCPVERVRWHDALRFANRLSRKQGLERCFVCSRRRCRVKAKFRGKQYTNCPGWRLPTEAEWEYAMRAGTTTPYYTGNCMTTRQANFNGKYPANNCPRGRYRRRTTPVKTFPPNPWKLYDMAGNVWEWIYDWHAPYQDTVDPVGPDTGKYRIYRGNGYKSKGKYSRSANRGYDDQRPKKYKDVGFRVVRTK